MAGDEREIAQELVELSLAGLQLLAELGLAVAKPEEGHRGGGQGRPSEGRLG